MISDSDEETQVHKTFDNFDPLADISFQANTSYDNKESLNLNDLNLKNLRLDEIKTEQNYEWSTPFKSSTQAFTFTPFSELKFNTTDIINQIERIPYNSSNTEMSELNVNFVDFKTSFNEISNTKMSYASLKQKSIKKSTLASLHFFL